jgi:hypothetical protein
MLADKSERRQAIDVMSDTARHILVRAVLHGQGRHGRQRLLRQRLDARPSQQFPGQSPPTVCTQALHSRANEAL